MRGLLKKVIGDTNQKYVKKLEKKAEKIEVFYEDIQALSDEDLARKTEEFKERYQQGEKLEQLLPEAYAVVAEASTRVMGMTPFPGFHFRNIAVV